MKANPPRWADRFLEWYCRPELLEEIQGDAHELFVRKSRSNKWRADLEFVWNVVRFFRWKNIRKRKIQSYSTTSYSMVKSYFLTGLRNMLRNATPAAINIIGLSVAIGCAVLIFILEDSYYNLDSIHKKGDRIGLVVNHIKEGDETEMTARSPVPLAELLRENSATEKVVRLGRSSAAVRVGDKVFNEMIHFSDPDFFEVFSFQLLSGDPNTLRSKNQILVTRDMALKYFGNDQVIGQSISLKFNDTYRQEFTIGGVLEDTPANSSMYIYFVVPSAVWEDMNKDQIEDWSRNLSVTFVLLKEGKSFIQLQPTFDAYKKFQNEANLTQPLQTVEMVMLPDVAQRSYELSGTLSWSNAPAAMVAFAVIATFLLLLACFNYMNVAVASVSTRLKEIGIRKVVGGGKREIIQQFLVENVLLCIIALLLGTSLAYFFLVPGFDALYPIKFAFEVSSWQMVLTFFGGLLLFIALVSGAYPALYVSSFSAVKIMRGKEKFGSKSTFSKVLLTMQFTLSITTMVGCLVFVWSGYYFEEKDWGYNEENTVALRLLNGKQFEEFKMDVASNKSILSFAGAQQHIGKSTKQAVVTYNEQPYSASQFQVGFGYMESMNIRLKSGRFFNESIESDKHESVVVNEAFVKKMGWANPLSETFLCDSVKRYVVGVVENFYYNDFYWAVEPAMFTITSPENFNYLVAKAEAGATVLVENQLKDIWRRIAPDDPYTGFLQSQVFENFMNSNRANNKVLFFISAVAVLLAAMGLYGLVSYNLTRRLKEFSVRKVFGASVLQLFRLMNRDYVWIVSIAFALGAPLGAYLMNMLLKAAYPETIPTTLWPYVLAVSVMILTVGLTIASQLKRVINENPTHTLRME